MPFHPPPPGLPPLLQPRTTGAHCHKMIRSVAQSAAGELYELLMKDNGLFEAWKKANPGLSPKGLEVRFIAREWGRCIPIARATLARMLSGPLDEASKESIMEALVLDSTLLRGRASGQKAIAGGHR